MGRIKLIHKTLKVYSFAFLFTLFLAMPLSYYFIHQIILEETDEELLSLYHKFNQLYAEQLDSSQIASFNYFNQQIQLNKISSYSAQHPKDTLFTETIFDSTKKELAPHRIFQTTVFIQQHPYLFTAKINLIENEDIIESLSIVFLILIVLLLLILIIMTQIQQKKLWNDFYTTIHRLRNFELSQQTPIHFSNSTIAEFDTLNRELEKLIQNNIQAYQQQKKIIENFAHELQTPLAILKSKIDNYLQKNSISPEELAFVLSIEKSLSRLLRLNKNLLLLAKIENNQFSETENINLTLIITDTIDLLHDYIQSKKLQVHLSLIPFTIRCNHHLIEMCISNLILNAIVHNVEQGKILIELKNNTLIISNTGLHALNQEKLFQRFAVLSDEKLQSGLGLAIVAEIAKRYHWKLSYTFQNNLHIFSITF